MRPCQRLDFNLILHCDDIIKSIENLERAWQFYHWCNLCFGWASVECGFSSLMSMLNQFMALIRIRIRLKLNRSHNIKRNHFVRTCQKDALNERYDDLYLEIRDDNGMIYDVSSTDQLALHLSMNHTELVEMQYKSMYDAGTFSPLFTLVWPSTDPFSKEHKRQQRCCLFNQSLEWQWVCCLDLLKSTTRSQWNIFSF